MALGTPTPAGAGHLAVNGGPGRMRAADADRDRVAGILGTAYTEGRLSKDEYDARLEAALSARTYADLDELVTDLPGTDLPVQADPAGPAALMARTNGYAMASFAFGLAQAVIGPLATIPAIVFGHMARRRISRTGEQGDDLAVTGLVLGWGVLILCVIILIAAGLVVSAGTHGTMPMP
ncbi:MAG TPA: DUF1707 and DUF4190 domain-containing protein [Trebonia sp.]|nr:DUF1707 and DUF4190 domain-containing protein [Trebonia sp.]